MKTRTHQNIRPSKARRRLHSLAQRVANLVVRILAPRFRVTGQASLPQGGSYILTPNHLSNVDSILLYCAVKRPLWIVAMRELFDNPVLAPIARLFRAFPIERGTADREALNFATNLLKNDQVLVLFPEGHLSVDGNLDPILPGATLLALRAGVPIIPVGISGSPKLVPYGLTWPRFTFAPIHVHLGEPVMLDDLKSLPRHTARQVATERLEIAIREAVAIAQKRGRNRNPVRQAAATPPEPS